MRTSFLQNNNSKFILLVLLLVLCWILGGLVPLELEPTKRWLSGFPVLWSGTIFILCYVGVTFFAWLTKDLFKIVGAFVFGATVSTLLIWVAEIINAVILFHLSRFLGRDYIEKRFKGLAGLDRKIEGGGFWGILALRAVPLVPFRFLDLTCGLTTLSFKKYFLIVFFGSPLRIFWIQFILAGVGEAFMKDPMALSDYLSKNVGVFAWSFTYLILAIVLVASFKRKWRAQKS